MVNFMSERRSHNPPPTRSRCVAAKLFGMVTLSSLGAGLHAQIITTAAGGTANGVVATSVSLNGANSVAVGGAGDLYIADTFNHVVRKVHANTVTTVAGTGTAGYSGDSGSATSAQLNSPWGVVVDVFGNVYIADPANHRVRKVSANGIITTVAGNGGSLYSGDGGPATDAQVANPLAIALDSIGNLYIADTDNQRIRKVDTSGTITTVAGNGSSGYSGDNGPAINAQLSRPLGIAIDASGNLYIADSNNNRLRKVDAGGTITTVAGNGGFNYSGDGGPAMSAEVASPSAVTTDAAGNLYIAAGWNQVRKVAASGTITTVAGVPSTLNDGGCYVLGYVCFAGDSGAATSAAFYGPYGVAVDAGGNLYIADTGNRRVRRVDTGGTIDTVVGNGTPSYSGDGGPATKAQLLSPAGMTLSAAGDLYIAEYDNDVVRKLDSHGTITTVAGVGPGPSPAFGGGYSGDAGAAVAAKLDGPSAVAVDASGNLYIADTRNNSVRKVNATGTITTVAGTGSAGYSGDSGVATSAQLDHPAGVAVDAAGTLYIADTYNNRIRKILANGTIVTVVGDGTAGYFGDGGAAASAHINFPAAIAVDAAGNLFIADFGNARVRKVDVGGTITTVAGNGDIGGYGDGGPATSAAVWGPRGLAVDTAGNLYIAAKEDFVVRKVDVGGIISTVAGNGRTWGFSGDGGLATNAQMIQPWGVAVNAAGTLYIADTGNNRIRKVPLIEIFKNGFEP